MNTDKADTTAKSIASLVRELASNRINEEKTEAAHAKAKAEAEREAILVWFAPVIDCAQALDNDRDISRKTYIFIKNHVLDSRPVVVVEISACSPHAKQTDKFTFIPNSGRVQVNKSGDVDGKILSVADACALMINEAADMIRHR